VGGGAGLRWIAAKARGVVVGPSSARIGGSARLVDRAAIRIGNRPGFLASTETTTRVRAEFDPAGATKWAFPATTEIGRPTPMGHAWLWTGGSDAGHRATAYEATATTARAPAVTSRPKPSRAARLSIREPYVIPIPTIAEQFGGWFGTGFRSAGAVGRLKPIVTNVRRARFLNVSPPVPTGIRTQFCTLRDRRPLDGRNWAAKMKFLNRAATRDDNASGSPARSHALC
jgi:hypothetical protein